MDYYVNERREKKNASSSHSIKMVLHMCELWSTNNATNPSITICFHDLGFKLIVGKVSQVSLTFNQSTCNRLSRVFRTLHFFFLILLLSNVSKFPAKCSLAFSLILIYVFVHLLLCSLFIFRIWLSIHQRGLLYEEKEGEKNVQQTTDIDICA